jgi:uroporphyrinogen-III decarboxylase
MLAAMSGRAGDGVPVAPCYPNIYLRRFEWQAYLDLYRARLGDATEYPVTPEEDNRIIFESKLESFKAWRELPDWIGVTRGPARATQMHSVVRARDGEFFLIDWSKQTETNLSALAQGESNELMSGRMQDLATSHELTFAQVDARVPVVPKAELLASGAFDVARRIIAEFQGRMFLHAVLSTPYTSAKYVVGFDNMLTGMRTAQDLIGYVVERHRQATEQLLEAWASLGIDAVFFQETLSGGDFISPEDYDGFVFPANKQLFERCQALGLKAIYYLTGDIRTRLPRILELGPDALAFEESRKRYVLDPAQIRAGVGERLCLFGNIDVFQVLEQGSEEDLRAEILRQIRSGRTAAGAFISGIGSPITPDTSPERVGTFIRMCRELGHHESL